MVSGCELGVRTTTWCTAPSPDATLTRIARNAGEETVRGLRVPPAWIVNVAGTRTFVAPPAGGEDLVELEELVLAAVEPVLVAAGLVLLALGVEALAAGVVLVELVLAVAVALLVL
jgi:hypothetical protein